MSHDIGTTVRRNYDAAMMQQINNVASGQRRADEADARGAEAYNAQRQRQGRGRSR